MAPVGVMGLDEIGVWIDIGDEVHTSVAEPSPSGRRVWGGRVKPPPFDRLLMPHAQLSVLE